MATATFYASTETPHIPSRTIILFRFLFLSVLFLSFLLFLCCFCCFCGVIGDIVGYDIWSVPHLLLTPRPYLKIFMAGTKTTTAEPAYSRAEGSDTFCLLQKKFPTKEVAFLRVAWQSKIQPAKRNHRRTNGLKIASKLATADKVKKKRPKSFLISISTTFQHGKQH